MKEKCRLATWKQEGTRCSARNEGSIQHSTVVGDTEDIVSNALHR